MEEWHVITGTSAVGLCWRAAVSQRLGCLAGGNPRTNSSYRPSLLPAPSTTGSPLPARWPMVSLWTHTPVVSLDTGHHSLTSGQFSLYTGHHSLTSGQSIHRASFIRQWSICTQGITHTPMVCLYTGHHVHPNGHSINRAVSTQASIHTPIHSNRKKRLSDHESYFIKHPIYPPIYPFTLYIFTHYVFN